MHRAVPLRARGPHKQQWKLCRVSTVTRGLSQAAATIDAIRSAALSAAERSDVLSIAMALRWAGSGGDVVLNALADIDLAAGDVKRRRGQQHYMTLTNYLPDVVWQCSELTYQPCWGSLLWAFDCMSKAKS